MSKRYDLVENGLKDIAEWNQVVAQAHVLLEQGRTMNTLRDTLPTGRTKYGAKRTEYAGRWYASKKEAARAADLDLLVKVGEVRGWTPQPRFHLVVRAKNGSPVSVGTYVADFEVVWADGRTTYEDTKGFRTPVYKLKKRLVEALYSITIEEK